ncbi:MAG: ABC transporter permease [Niallia sp.]
MNYDYANTVKRRSLKRLFHLNQRTKMIVTSCLALFLLLFIMIYGHFIDETAIEMDLNSQSQAPSLAHPFGTDWIGRDMFVRTMKGMSISIWVGIIASLASSFISIIIGSIAAFFGKKVDKVITWFIDVTMGMPMLIFMILLSVLFGKGIQGIIIGLVLTHWVYLARVVRAEVMQIRSSPYVKVSQSFGKSKGYIMIHHIIPHALPQFIVGAVLMFPHAILHEAALTFLGFGLPVTQPAIGIILSESMGYLSTGLWWLAVIPGLALVVMVRIFDILGDQLQLFIDPKRAQE